MAACRAQSIPLNIAEGNGKRSLKDRNRFFDIARGLALECASIQDVLTVCEGIDAESHRDGKQQLKRIVSMLTKLIARPENVGEPATQYQAGVDYEYEYRFPISNGKPTFPAR